VHSISQNNFQRKQMFLFPIKKCSHALSMLTLHVITHHASNLQELQAHGVKR